MYDVLNINKGFEAMLPESESPKVEEVSKTRELSIKFRVLSITFKIALTFTRD